MKRSITRWTTSLAAAALLGLPVAGMAQTPTTAQSAATTPQQPPAASASTQNAAAQEHLRQAKSAVDTIAPTAVTGKARTQLAELKRHINALQRVTGTNSSAGNTNAAQRDNPRANAAGGNANWGTEVTAIDKILTSLLGPANSATMPAPSGTATGTTGSDTTSVKLDETTRTQLIAVRTHVIAFAAAMSGSPTGAAATSDPSASSTTGSTVGAATATSTTATTPRQDPAGSPIDTEAARRHLTEVRTTLAELTQLPAAAQLDGEARTQVSQLIANFNELITTKSEWRTSYAKVEANLAALLGPDAAIPTGGVSTGTTGTAGAVGTSGTTTGAASLDPAIRAKLLEMRQELSAFEEAASRNAAPDAATTSAAGATAGAMTGTAGSVQSTTPPTTTPPQVTAQPAEATGHEEALRHIAAIEALLNLSASATSTSSPTGTSGNTAAAGLTLTSAQLDQLKTHLAELRRLVGQAKK